MRRTILALVLILVVTLSASILAVTVIPPKESVNGYVYHSWRQRVQEPEVSHPSGQFSYDFEVQNLDGKFISLDQFKGKPLVIETGSITCSLAANRSITMDQIFEKYDGGLGSDANILLLYTREAHPGWIQGSPDSQEEKLELARRLKVKGIDRRIFVDSFDGSLHKAIGLRNNSVMVIDQNGKIVLFRSSNRFPDRVDKILSKLTRTESVINPDSESINKLKSEKNESIWLSFGAFKLPNLKTMFVGGPDAYFDFWFNGPWSVQNSHKNN